MNRNLVAYFSVTGTTTRAATLLARMTGADLFAIRPAVPYTRRDLDWRSCRSRSSLEMDGILPWAAMAGPMPAGLAACDVVFLGFPIWWDNAPTIIRTFLSAGDFSGKTVVLFATSGGSGFGKTAGALRPLLPAGCALREGAVMQEVSWLPLRACLEAPGITPCLWAAPDTGRLVRAAL